MTGAQWSPEVRKRAWRVVQDALWKGVLARPDACSSCGTITLVQGHHHNGYDDEHALDVVWLCPRCHYAAEHPVVVRENVKRRVNQNSAKTHCKRGHPFDEENTYYVRGTQRQCRACRSITRAALAKERGIAPRNKLSAENVAEIRSRVDAGEDRRDVAASFGVNRTAVDRIMRGERWPETRRIVWALETEPPPKRCGVKLSKRAATTCELPPDHGEHHFGRDPAGRWRQWSTPEVARA